MADTLLTSMELSPAEAKEESGATPEAPKYPWGLCIDLNEDTLKKLGITDLPAVGSSMLITAKADVQSAGESQYQGDDTKRMNLSLQITDMSMSPAAKDVAASLYNGK